MGLKRASLLRLPWLSRYIHEEVVLKVHMMRSTDTLNLCCGCLPACWVRVSSRESLDHLSIAAS